MRMTKELAKQIARKLTVKKIEVSNQIFIDYRQAVTDAYIKQTPKEVAETFKKHPDWFYTRSGISFSGHGFRWETVTATEQVICNSRSDANLNLDDKLAAKLTNLKRKNENAVAAYNALVDEIETALFNLRTFANVEKNFPEAIPFLPASTSTALMVNFDALRKKIA